MNIYRMKQSDFKDIPLKEDIEPVIFDSLVIIPSKRIHDSGWRTMDFIAVKHNEPLFKISGNTDVLNIDGIGGYGDFGIPNSRPIEGWKIDCLPCGFLRLTNNKQMMVQGYAVSDYEVFYK